MLYQHWHAEISIERGVLILEHSDIVLQMAIAFISEKRNGETFDISDPDSVSDYYNEVRRACVQIDEMIDYNKR